YKTTSTDAALVLANLIPAHILAQERSGTYCLNLPEKRYAARERTLEIWQQEWNQSTKGRWTHRLIGDIKGWVHRKHGNITFRMTQCFTGHGVFMQYIARIKKRVSSDCMYCEHPCDDAEHTLFHCPRFEEERENVKKEIGSEIKTENLTSIMLEASEKWESIKKYMEEIIKVKERDEREGNKYHLL
ncbi:jg26342, partial [Pararge aegeria aegeria]